MIRAKDITQLSLEVINEKPDLQSEFLRRLAERCLSYELDPENTLGKRNYGFFEKIDLILIGHRARMKKKRKLTRWQLFLQEYKSVHPDLPFDKFTTLAAEEYKRFVLSPEKEKD